MKKAISLTLLLLGVILIYQFVAGIFKTSHEVNYYIEKDNYKINVLEKFEHNKYYFTISNNGFDYVFDTSNYFGKRTEVLSDILVTSNDNLECIYPVYQGETTGNIFDKILSKIFRNNGRGNDNVAGNVRGNIVCSDKSNIYAYESVKDNDLVVDFVNYLKQNNYKSSLFDEKKYDKPNKVNGIEYYKDYIDEVITLWNYRGITVLNNKTGYTTELLSFDRYENTLGVSVGKYYVIPNYINNNLFEIDGFYIIDLVTNDQNLVNLDFIMSDKSYINGVIDDKLYIFDKTNMRQIEINVKKKEIKTVSSKNNAKYYDNDWVERNIYDFKNSELKFNYINKDDVSGYNINNVYQSDDSYFVYENNTMYQIYKNNLDKKITLFYGKELKEIKVIDNNLYYIIGNTLYRYNDMYSVKKLLTYSELKYNYKNIVNIYK